MSSGEKRQRTPANRIKDNLEKGLQDSDSSESETYGGEWASLACLYHSLKKQLLV